MEPTLSFIKHILKDYFDFIDRIDTQCTVNTILSTFDKFHDDIPLLSQFTKAFILEGLNIILKFNYFRINKNFFHQIKGTAMGTLLAAI